MKISRIIRTAFYPDGATSLPKGICFTLFLLILCNGMVVSNVFPYLPELVKAHGGNEVNAANKVGVIASTMFLTRIFSSLMWGYICDKFGTKFSLILSGSGLTFSTLMFAFSYNYTWVVVFRSLQGFFMGLFVISKSIISDLSDDTNLAFGLNIIFSGRNIGFILGPTISGYLVFPVEKYPNVFSKGSFWDAFKVFLPNLIISVGLLLGLLVTVFLFPKNSKNRLGDEVIVRYENLNCTNVEPDAYLNLSVNYASESKNCEECSEVTTLVPSSASMFTKYCSRLKSTNIAKLFSNKDFLLTNTIYVIFSMFFMGHNELFPVFVATPPQYKGLGMTTSDIGLLYLIISLVILVVQATILSKLVNKFGAKKVFCASSLLFSVSVNLLPTTELIKNRTTRWMVLLVNQCLIRIATCAGFLSVNIFINNSVESELLGLANGLAMSTASIGSSIGAIVFGSAFTWSMKNIKKSEITKENVKFPINQYFAFTLMALMSLLVMIIAILIPKSLNKKKTRNQQEKRVPEVTVSYFQLV